MEIIFGCFEIFHQHIFKKLETNSKIVNFYNLRPLKKAKDNFLFSSIFYIRYFKINNSKRSDFKIIEFFQLAYFLSFLEIYLKL